MHVSLGLQFPLLERLLRFEIVSNTSNAVMNSQGGECTFHNTSKFM